MSGIRHGMAGLAGSGGSWTGRRRDCLRRITGQKTSAKTSKQKWRISNSLLSVPIMASWHPNGTCSKSSLSPEIHQICTFCRVLVVDCDGLLPFVFCGFVAQQRQFEATSKVGNSFVHILYWRRIKRRHELGRIEQNTKSHLYPTCTSQ